MRRLIIINTYYQLIFAMQLKRTLFRDDTVTLLVSDHSRNADVIAENLKGRSLFEETGYVVTTGRNRSSREKLEDFLQITFGKDNRYRVFTNGLSKRQFDEILVFNYDMGTYGLHALLCRENTGIRISQFEEGVLSYNSPVIHTARRKLINFLRALQGKPVAENALKNFYCFYPELYHGELQPVKVEKIAAGSPVTEDIKKVFQVEGESLSYPEKYIFFTSVYDFEGGQPIGEFELVCRVAEKVGKENLLVKVHPRDARTIYTDNGFRVDRNSSIPWEAIQMSGDFSDKVFLTATSGSVLAGSFLSERPTRTLYLYRLCDLSGNPKAQVSAKAIEDLLANQELTKVLSDVHVAGSIEEI